MSIAASSSSYAHQTLLTSTFRFTHKPKTKVPINSLSFISCRFHSDGNKDSSWGNEKQLAKLAMVTLAAGVLTLGSVADASAAKSGGRVGGQAFRSSAPRSAPRGNNNSRTNIYINPRTAPPLVGGYGYGYGAPIYGGWGWSPFSFFAPGPSVAVGVGGGFDTLVFFMFLGAFAAVVRKFFGSRNEDEDDY